MAQLDVDPSPQEQVEPVAGRKPMPFFPDFALIEAITALCFLVALLIVAADRTLARGDRGPTASGYVPRPEWYFLWAFQMLKYFKGEAEVLGTSHPDRADRVDRSPVHRSPRGRRLRLLGRPVRLWPRLVALSAMAGSARSPGSPTPRRCR